MDIKEWKNSDQTNLRRHPWERGRSAIILDLLKSSEIELHSPLRVLDFGSGDLSVVRDLAQYLPKAQFIAIDQAYSEPGLSNSLRKLGAAENIQGFYPSLQAAEKVLPGEKVDLVLLLDVLEHCKDDLQVLIDVRNSTFIKEDTLFIITLPSHQELWSKHDLFLAHFRRYKTDQLQNLIRAAGFTSPIQKIGYFFASLLVVRYLQVFIERNFQRIALPWSNVSTRRRMPVLDSMLVAVLRFDYSLGKALRKLNIPAPGLSCFAVFRA